MVDRLSNGWNWYSLCHSGYVWDLMVEGVVSWVVWCLSNGLNWWAMGGGNVAMRWFEYGWC